MKFTTVQSMAFKTSFEVLKDIINDANMYFTKDGIRILTLDTARSALVDLNLSCENFESYSCPTDVVAGVNITNTYKILKTITNNDTLTVEILQPDYMNIHIENSTKKSNTHFRLKLLDINEEIIEVPKVDMTVMTTLPSVDFQRICRDMNNLGQEIEITRRADKFIIKCDGDFAHQETVVECTDDTQFSGCISAAYSLKYINLFTRATSMCSTIQVMQEETHKFLILKYNVANLGVLSFYLASKIEDE